MNTKTGFVSYDFHDFHDIHCRKGYRGYHVWSRDLRISEVMTFSKSPKNHPTMASSLPQLQPSDRTYRTLGLQMTTKFFEIDHPFLPGDFSGRFEQKKGVVLIVWTYFLHISATSWFRISSFKNGIHFSTRHTNPPSLAEEHEPSPAAVWRAEAVHVQRLDDSEEPGQWSYQGDAKDVNRWKGNPGNWWNIILFTYIYIYLLERSWEEGFFFSEWGGGRWKQLEGGGDGDRSDRRPRNMPMPWKRTARHWKIWSPLEATTLVMETGWGPWGRQLWVLVRWDRTQWRSGRKTWMFHVRCEEIDEDRSGKLRHD